MLCSNVHILWRPYRPTWRGSKRVITTVNFVRMSRFLRYCRFLGICTIHFLPIFFFALFVKTFEDETNESEKENENEKLEMTLSFYDLNVLDLFSLSNWNSVTVQFMKCMHNILVQFYGRFRFREKIRHFSSSHFVCYLGLWLFSWTNIMTVYFHLYAVFWQKCKHDLL